MPKKNTTIRFWLIGVICALVAALGLFFYLPITYTLYFQPDDGQLKAANALLPQTPLEECIDGNFENVTSLDLLFGTYARRNTNQNHVEIFSFHQNKKLTLYQTDFSSDSVKDNDYFSIPLPGLNVQEQFCFLLVSYDGTAQNSITYWLNSQSQPVLKIRSTMPIYKAMNEVQKANLFHLPIWMVTTLCLIYLSADICAFFLLWYGNENIPTTSSADPPGTREK